MNKSICSAGIWALFSLAIGCAPCKGGQPAGEVASATGAENVAEKVVPAMKIQSEEVVYLSGATELRGFLAYPADVTGKRPGVLVAHEWWGLNDYVRSRALKLAELGYVALAVDMYGEGKVAEHPADAEKFMMSVMGNKEEGRRRIEAGKAFLAQSPHTDPTKIAAIGYCMGGALALNMARAGDDLALVGVFHGNLSTSAPLQQGVFKGKIFVAHGGSDPFVPEAQLIAFKQEMENAGVDFELAVYPEVKHGFTNPGASELGERFQIPLAYDKAADEDSWSRLIALLAAVWN